MSGRSLTSAINAKSLEPALKKAFSKNPVAVALAINCPGGQPVQAALIVGRIRALAAENNVPVLAFCEDVAASGGYWLACSADEIYADANSMIGSIGVIASGFGAPKALAKLGLERRVYTAGASKNTNDPFKPEKPQDVKKLQVILDELHENFKNMVSERRGGKLKSGGQKLFDGSFWTGRKALELGLIDGLGHAHGVLKARFGDKVEIYDISISRSLGQRWLGLSGSHALATEFGETLLTVLDRRALWARFGL